MAPLGELESVINNLSDKKAMQIQILMEYPVEKGKRKGWHYLTTILGRREEIVVWFTYLDVSRRGRRRIGNMQVMIRIGFIEPKNSNESETAI